ncbi:ABC transporter ATP-binding protein/permease [Catenulispora sp. NL8]|uniref:ABC transporter ATP-binding protein/permease n=1 Tax=Catenulispora pinistramenti TaxID=2705254 RepID=A0ABS5L2D5_9ACTN|nr:ABC transporter ATP-binding protein/permease [Catenulispora pinistramenti]MBS2552409.1 ABC transporter ATP-binding protein/permease [Catenulispora pinistramenti]
MVADLRLVVNLCRRYMPRASLWLLLLTCATALAPSTLALGMQSMLDGVLTHSLAKVWPGVVETAVSGAFMVAGRRVVAVQQTIVGQTVGTHLDRKILNLCATLPGTAHVDDPAALYRVEQVRGLGVRAMILSVQAVTIMRALVWLVFAVIMLGTVHPLLALLPAAALPSLVLVRSSARSLAEARQQSAEHHRAAQHLLVEFLTPASAKELRGGRSGGYLREIARQRRESAVAQMARAQRRVMIGTLVGAVALTVSCTAALLFAAHLAASHAASPGSVLLVLTIGGQLRAQCADVFDSLRMSARGLEMIGHYRWLAALHRESASKGGSPVPTTLTTGIELRDVVFRYGSAEPTLEGIDLLLPAGATVALVGLHGSGKSTLVKLLLGMVQPTSGRITVDGVPLDDFRREQWCARTTAAFQDFSRFPLLAGEDVGVGDLSRLTDIDDAARRGGAEAVFNSLPHGRHTRLGTAFGDGVGLSGGQWQKIAASRAFMRTDPLLAVLDEPTAALDADSERQVYHQYNEAARTWRTASGGITVLVSHRFATVRAADLIVVLANGHIVETGSHRQLMARNGRYAELYRLQEAAYR